MTRRIYLLRHAKSDHGTGVPDHARPLNARGRGAAELMGAHIEEVGINPALVLCSSSVRTRETLEGVVGGFAEVPEISLEDDLYNPSTSTLIDRLQRVEESVPSVMLIGHQPSMQHLALTLSESGLYLDRVHDHFPTGSLVTLETGQEWAEIGPACCYLVAFTTPQDLTAS